jgi:arylsulfatase A
MTFCGNHRLSCIMTIFCWLAAIAATDLAAQPNIIFILADDMGYADLGADRSRIDTPHLDQMARDGMRLTRFYAGSPVCSPTRAAFLTGRYPHSVGVPEICSPEVRGPVPMLNLALDAVTIPEALKPLGYTSMLAGKWHLGYESPYWPRKHGFDEFWGSLLGTPKYWNPEETYHNETPITVNAYFTDAITDNAVRFIREQQENPFFLYLAYNAPHFPLEAPEALIQKYNGIFRYDKFAVYAAMVEQMDTGIGRVFATLDELDLRDDTIVMFTSDNGPSDEKQTYGPRGARISAGPLRGNKKLVYEGGIRVPFIARWPGHIPAGKTSDQVATVIDMFPTYLDILNVTPAPDHTLNGRSILPLLQGGNANIHQDDVLHWQIRKGYTAMQGPWKMVLDAQSKAPELYNIAQDLGETKNLAKQHPDILNAMIEQSNTWSAQYYPAPYWPLPRH